jgi:hypothetical protein
VEGDVDDGGWSCEGAQDSGRALRHTAQAISMVWCFRLTSLPLHGHSHVPGFHVCFLRGESDRRSQMQVDAGQENEAAAKLLAGQRSQRWGSMGSCTTGRVDHSGHEPERGAV